MSSNSGHYPSPVDPTRTRIGWIGIGVMGHAMASRLISAGYNLTIYARDPSKAAPLLSLHGGAGATTTLASTPAHLAATCHVIFTVLSHPSDVRHVVLESLLPHLPPHAVLVDHTTSQPSLAGQIYRTALQKQIHSVDAPVSGGDIGAREGKLAIFAGGDPNVVRWLTPLFDLMGRVKYMGEAGKGQSCKIANQITVAVGMIGLGEGLIFAEKAGLDKRKWIEAVSGGAAGSMAMELYGDRMIGRDFRPGGSVEYMVKDLGMIDYEKKDGGGDRDVTVLPGTSLCKQLFVGMVANGDGKKGLHGVVTVMERMNGMRN